MNWFFGISFSASEIWTSGHATSVRVRYIKEKAFFLSDDKKSGEKMQLTQQIKIKPTIAQEWVLETLSEKCRLLYNFALSERKEAFRNKVKGVNYYKQQNDLPKIKEKFPEYKWVYSKVLQYILRTLDADYKSFFALWKKGSKDARPPKFKGKKWFTTIYHNQSGFKHWKGHIELSHKHPSKTKLRFKIPEKFSFKKIYQISVYKKDSNFYLSITYEKVEKEYKDNGLYQAFDLGVTKQTAVNSKGKFIEIKNERPDKYRKNKVNKLQSRRDHCKKNSKRYRLFTKNFRRVKKKCGNQLKDFQHKLSTKIVKNTKANTIIVGDLSIKKLCKINKYEKGLHRSLHNTGNIFRFVQFLTYKAKLMGKRVIEINERNTTKTCCVCGKKQDMPLSRRVYVCDCGNVMDRDRNSSINIMMRYLSKNGLWTAYRRFVGNLRQTGVVLENCAIHSQEAIILNTKRC